MEPADHLGNQDYPCLEGVDLPLLRGVQQRRHTQLCCRFSRRPSCVQEESTELGHRAPTTCFRYVRAYGEGCTYELVAPFETLWSAERASETHRVGRQLASELVHTESWGMSLERHTAPL